MTQNSVGDEVTHEIVLPMNVIGDLGALVQAAAFEISLFGHKVEVEA